MEFDARIPIYIQIITKIQRDIIRGKIQKGEKLPSVRSMAAELKVNVNTVQRVYQELERQKVIDTQRGTGSFITEDEEIIKDIKNRLADELVKDFLTGLGELGYTKDQILQCLVEHMRGD
jgi:DNA-binding transcriptional regulator YhcF (GntR family)